MTSDQPDPDADPYAEHPEESIFPGAGRRVTDEEREAALRAGLMGATVGDTEDAEEDAEGVAQEGAEPVDGGDQAD